MPKRVLVAEDQEDNANIAMAMLEHFGYEPIRAADGVAALQLARERAPDLILLDVSMPRMDGWDVCKTLKADPATQSIRIVMLTAHAMEVDRLKAFECGADDYIAKPVEPRKVLQVVKNLIGEP